MRGARLPDRIDVADTRAALRLWRGRIHHESPLPTAGRCWPGTKFALKKSWHGVADSVSPQVVADLKHAGDLSQIASIALALPGAALLVRCGTGRAPRSDLAHAAARCGPAASSGLSRAFELGHVGRLSAWRGGNATSVAA